MEEWLVQKCKSVPLFVRSGLINLPGINEAALRRVGEFIYDWSSRTYHTNTFAYYLSFGDGEMSPSYANNRWYAFPLRCLSAVLDV